MKTSTERILTTHVGSLPRPQDVVDFLFAQDRGEPYDPAKFEETMKRGVAGAIAHQVESGVDIVSDGEMSKISYATYIRHRLTGFEGDSSRPTPSDIDAIPAYRDKLVKEGHSATYKRPVCKGPVAREGSLGVARGHRAHEGRRLPTPRSTEGFMNAVSPGTIAVFQPNEYYPSHEAYWKRLPDAMREEYEMIVNSGSASAARLPGPGDGPAHHTSRISPTKSSSGARRSRWMRSITRWPMFPPTACACTSAGATMKVRTPTICR